MKERAPPIARETGLRFVDRGRAGAQDPVVVIGVDGGTDGAGVDGLD